MCGCMKVKPQISFFSFWKYNGPQRAATLSEVERTPAGEEGVHSDRGAERGRERGEINTKT